MQVHPVAEIFPMLEGAELEALAADIRENGLREAIWTHKDRIIDGRNRYAACELAGVEPSFREWDGEEGRLAAFVVSLNLHRRHLSESQRAMVAARLANLPRGANQHASIDATSQSEAAKLLNVSRPSVQRASQVRASGVPELAQAVERGGLAVSAAAKIAKLEPEAQREALKKPHVSHNSGDNEWYTPSPYIEAAVKVMGAIDLDPASTKEANKVVCARKFFTASDDGLSKPWAGRVWMNPPYASEFVGKFIETLAAHVEAHEVSEAIVLVNNATETQWFQRLASVASAVCFPAGRVRFWKTDSTKAAPLQGQAVLYIGRKEKTFAKAFHEFGIICLLNKA